MNVVSRPIDAAMSVFHIIVHSILGQEAMRGVAGACLGAAQGSCVPARVVHERCRPPVTDWRYGVGPIPGVLGGPAERQTGDCPQTVSGATLPLLQLERKHLFMHDSG